MVRVIRDGRAFPTAHVVAHRTTLDRADLAYHVDQRAWMHGDPAVPTYFFRGRAVVGEEYREHPVVVMVPAVRR